MDKRIVKSKRAIEKALIQLMYEKDFEQITINAIAEKAIVNRGTIYLHYTDKYDLLEKCIEREVQELITSCSPNVSDKNFFKASLLQTFNYIEENFFLYHTLLTNNGTTAFREKLLDVIRHNIEHRNLVDDNRNSELLTEFWASAIIGVIEWWIKNNKPCTGEDVTEQLWLLLEQNHILPK